MKIIQRLSLFTGRGEEEDSLSFVRSSKEIVRALINCRKYIASFFTNHIDLCHVPSKILAQSELFTGTMLMNFTILVDERSQ